jgi:hypothetical protein
MAKKRVKSELSLVFGSEPKFDMVAVAAEDYNNLLGSALRWFGKYGGAETPAELRKRHKSWLLYWAEANGIKKRTFAIPVQGIETMAALSRIATKGFPLQQKHIDRLKQAFADWIPVKAVPVDKEAIAKLISYKARLKHESVMTPVVTIFDNAIDSVLQDGAKTWDVNTSSSLNVKQANELAAMYKGELKQIQAAYDKSSQDMMENYDYPRMTLRRLIAVFEAVLAEIDKCSLKGDVKRKVRKARVKKVIPASAYVKNLQFLPKSDDLNLVSIEPEQLMGAEVAYVYDTQKRLLKIYTALTSEGITVSGTTLKNVKGEQKVIRRPDSQLQPFVKKTRIGATKEFKDIRAKLKVCTGRMNKNVLILRRFP